MSDQAESEKWANRSNSSKSSKYAYQNKIIPKFGSMGSKPNQRKRDKMDKRKVCGSLYLVKPEKNKPNDFYTNGAHKMQKPLSLIN